LGPSRATLGRLAGEAPPDGGGRVEQQIRFLTMPEGPRIAYAVFGRGPAIVATPPLSEHLEIVWQFPARRALWEALAQHHTVVVYDRWGTGLSTRERTDFSLDADVCVLEAVTDQLKLRRFALFGASGGGPTAITYAARHPRRLSHLILYGTAARREIPPSWAPMRALMLADWQLASRTLAESFFRDAEPVDTALVSRLLFESATPEVVIGLHEASLS
jgi:pimeloyl-ACP methyl ester carboxylesterase